MSDLSKYLAAPLVQAGGNVLGGLGGFFGTGKKAQQEQLDLAQTAADDIAKFYKGAKKGKYDMKFGVDPAFNELYEMSKVKTSRDPLLRQGATAMGALEAGGERTLLAGLNPTTRALAEGEVQLGLTDLQREMTGLQTLATERQAAQRAEEQANKGFFRELGLRQLAGAEQAEATALQNAEDMRRARQDAFGTLLGGVGALGTVALGSKMGLFEHGGKLEDESGDGQVTKKDHLINIGVLNKDGSKNYMMGGDVLSQIMSQGKGMPPVQGPLPGEASHETNPIDMIDKNGQKVGEAMGGEFIINDEQAGEIMGSFKDVHMAITEEQREPTKEEFMALYEANLQVFGQPQFQGQLA